MERTRQGPLYTDAVTDCIIIDGCTPASEQDVIDAYQRLIDNGTIAYLQGSRQRTAHYLIRVGLCTPAERN